MVNESKIDQRRSGLHNSSILRILQKNATLLTLKRTSMDNNNGDTNFSHPHVRLPSSMPQQYIITRAILVPYFTHADINFYHTKLILIRKQEMSEKGHMANGANHNPPGLWSLISHPLF